MTSDLILSETEKLDQLNTIQTEVNLANLPFFALSRKDAKEKKEIRYAAKVHRDGKMLEVAWDVIPSTRYGCPGPFDKRVHKAIEYIINERGIPTENPIPFSMYQIARIMRITRRGGQNYRKIREAIERVVATTVKSEGTFYRK